MINAAISRRGESNRSPVALKRIAEARSKSSMIAILKRVFPNIYLPFIGLVIGRLYNGINKSISFSR